MLLFCFFELCELFWVRGCHDSNGITNDKKKIIFFSNQWLDKQGKKRTDYSFEKMFTTTYKIAIRNTIASSTETTPITYNYQN